MPAPKAPASQIVYQIKATLKHTKPPIWRRILVTGDTKLSDLHLIMQAVMGFADYHLHQFTIGLDAYGVPDEDDYQEVLDERKYRLARLIPGEGFRFTYTYDFGDDWEHALLVEKILPFDPGKQYPVCVGGRRSGPPEDVGGVWGYAEFLEAIRDPANPERDEWLQWAGKDFDPEAFDLTLINARLGWLRRNRSRGAINSNGET